MHVGRGGRQWRGEAVGKKATQLRREGGSGGEAVEREAVERGSSGKGGDTVDKGGRQWGGGSGEGSSGEGEGESAHMHVGGSFFHVQVLVLWCMKCAVQHQRCLFNGIEGVPARCLFNGIEGVPARSLFNGIEGVPARKFSFFFVFCFSR